jgi:hypothetical protein
MISVNLKIVAGEQLSSGAFPRLSDRHSPNHHLYWTESVFPEKKAGFVPNETCGFSCCGSSTVRTFLNFSSQQH